MWPPNVYTYSLPGKAPAISRAQFGRKAFTVIELLVVTAIIVLLSMMLFSGTRRIRHSSDKIQNTANLRALGVATLSYATDHNGKTPPNTRDGLVTRFMGYGMSSGTSLRKLYSTTNYGPVGQGTLDYLPSPDCLYGPFTKELYKTRARGKFFYSSEAGTYRAGYWAYNLPRIDQKGMPPELDGCFNDRLTENPRAPLYSDHFTWSEFTGTEVSVVFLDGSMRDFSKEDMDRNTSSKARLKLFTGIP